MGKPAVKERTPEAAPASTDNGTCRHHWIIESPHGALSDGRCKICGEERQFRNSASDYIWDDDSSSGYGRWGGARPSTTVKAIEEDDMTAAPDAAGRSEVAIAL